MVNERSVRFNKPPPDKPPPVEPKGNWWDFLEKPLPAAPWTKKREEPAPKQIPWQVAQGKLFGFLGEVLDLPGQALGATIRGAQEHGDYIDYPIGRSGVHRVTSNYFEDGQTLMENINNGTPTRAPRPREFHELGEEIIGNRDFSGNPYSGFGEGMVRAGVRAADLATMLATGGVGFQAGKVAANVAPRVVRALPGATREFAERARPLFQSNAAQTQTLMKNIMKHPDTTMVTNRSPRSAFDIWGGSGKFRNMLAPELNEARPLLLDPYRYSRILAEETIFPESVGEVVYGSLYNDVLKNFAVPYQLGKRGSARVDNHMKIAKYLRRDSARGYGDIQYEVKPEVARQARVFRGDSMEAGASAAGPSNHWKRIEPAKDPTNSWDDFHTQWGRKSKNPWNEDEYEYYEASLPKLDINDIQNVVVGSSSRGEGQDLLKLMQAIKAKSGRDVPLSDNFSRRTYEQERDYYVRNLRYTEALKKWLKDEKSKRVDIPRLKKQDRRVF